ncbi:CGH_1_collapsed_G0050640.mRNA.1.CDS.1 [Saccharomyces cerevisiae]|nr:CGH_1_collapsed_G0050640.mRNA.1.CDS.1 [Saccharomyces cerevisiae]
MVSTFEENLDKMNYSTDPIGYVCDTSWHKAQNIIEILTDYEDENPNEIDKPKLIICADTIIIDKNGRIYEKPKTKEVQKKCLMKFCYEDDEPVNVVTAWYHSDETKNNDNKIPLRILEEYVESGDGLEVGGGFKIQEQGAILIEKIEGDYYNVVGLPLNKTFKGLYAEANSI